MISLKLVHLLKYKNDVYADTPKYYFQNGGRPPSSICESSRFGYVLHVILYLRSEFRVNQPLWRGDIAKKNNYKHGDLPPS